MAYKVRVAFNVYRIRDTTFMFVLSKYCLNMKAYKRLCKRKRVKIFILNAFYIHLYDTIRNIKNELAYMSPYYLTYDKSFVLKSGAMHNRYIFQQ